MISVVMGSYSMHQFDSWRCIELAFFFSFLKPQRYRCRVPVKKSNTYVRFLTSIIILFYSVRTLCNKMYFFIVIEKVKYVIAKLTISLGFG